MTVGNAGRGQTARYLARAAQSARELEERRVLCTDLRHLVDELERLGVIVAGERALLGQLDVLLDEAWQALGALERADTISTIEERLTAWEAVLAHVLWDVAGQVRGELEGKLREQQERIREYPSQVAELRALLNEVEQELSTARRVGALALDQEREMKRLEDLVSQAERAQRAGQYPLLASLLARSAAEGQRLRPPPDQQLSPLVAEIRKETAQALRFARQAELMVLQSPVDQHGRHVYSVLLRTANRPGIHGVNVRGSSTVVKQDRKAMEEILHAVTAAINRRQTRAFSPPPGGQATTAQPVPAPEPAGVLSQPAGGPGQEGHPPLAAVEGAGQAGQPPAAAADAGSLRRFLSGEELLEDQTAASTGKLVEDLGEFMYRLLIPEQMQDYLARQRCAVTITTNDLELPWELMAYREPESDELKYLCLEKPTARMPMGDFFPREPRRTLARGKFRFLLICADPREDLAFARVEIDKLREALDDAQFSDRLEQPVTVLNAAQASGREITQVLRGGKFDVIHYAGHAGFDQNDADLTGLLLHEEELCLAQKIRRLLEGQPIVFLNACEAARTANEREPQRIERYLQEPAEGLASAFIYGGARACIGSLWPVYDEPAREFAVEFYRHVLENQTIGEAMRVTRRAIKERHQDQITWATFVLYGDPTFRLQEVEERAP